MCAGSARSPCASIVGGNPLALERRNGRTGGRTVPGTSRPAAVPRDHARFRCGALEGVKQAREEEVLRPALRHEAIRRPAAVHVEGWLRPNQATTHARDGRYRDQELSPSPKSRAVRGRAKVSRRARVVCGRERSRGRTWPPVPPHGRERNLCRSAPPTCHRKIVCPWRRRRYERPARGAGSTALLWLESSVARLSCLSPEFAGSQDRHRPVGPPRSR